MDGGGGRLLSDKDCRWPPADRAAVCLRRMASEDGHPCRGPTDGRQPSHLPGGRPLRRTIAKSDVHQMRTQQGCHADDSGRTDGRSDDGPWVIRDLDAL
jgi:hypothetical protein